MTRWYVTHAPGFQQLAEGYAAGLDMDDDDTVELIEAADCRPNVLYVMDGPMMAAQLAIDYSTGQMETSAP